jgi:hypothetical protein
VNNRGIFCGNCEKEVTDCDRSSKHIFLKGSEIYCEEYGERHFCSSDCFFEAHETFVDTCEEKESV